MAGNRCKICKRYAIKGQAYCYFHKNEAIKKRQFNMKRENFIDDFGLHSGVKPSGNFSTIKNTYDCIR